MAIKTSASKALCNTSNCTLREESTPLPASPADNGKLAYANSGAIAYAAANTLGVIDTSSDQTKQGSLGFIEGYTAGGTIRAGKLVMGSSTSTLLEATAGSERVIGVQYSGTDKTVGQAFNLFKKGELEVTADQDTDIGVWLKAAYDGNVIRMVDGEIALTTFKSGSGGNFGNQPANDQISIVSDSASDTQTLTIWGTTHGGSVVTSEDIVLTGTVAVDTVKLDWGVVVGLEITGAAVGTITVSEKSGGLTISTITAGNTTSGLIALPADARMYNELPSVVAGGASSKLFALEGIDYTGTPFLEAVTMNGTTAVNFTTKFKEVIRILAGDVASATTVTVKHGSADSPGKKIGKSLEAGTSGSTMKIDLNPS